ncbi:MAG: DUF4920 domain-containing protein [Chitinophagales bacterium]|nr:DUF4920 domain-containing protein [Chitinophagaceae bacterium]MCB9066107.1 DUF4920 domain-containing protein [Chitinophagales bacterium]
MKKFQLLFVASGIFLYSCNSDTGNNEETATTEEVASTSDSTYGAAFSPDGAITVDEFNTNMQGNDSLDNVVVTGELSEVCQKMGCWVKLKNDSGEDIFVKLKGHDFFVPKDCAGKTAVVKGKATREVTPVDELQHYLEDAGASEEEIAAVTEPKEELRIEAEGIIVKF